MLAFLILVFLTFLLIIRVNTNIRPFLRTHFIFYSSFIIIIGLISILIYTFDNLYHEQVDMPGDAQYYYEGAISYLETGETQTFYPNYERFLALFLYMGDPVIARMAQLMVFLCMYALVTQALDWLRISKTGFIYFSAFTSFSGIYYAMLVAFVRDLLILFTFAFIFVAFAWYYAKLEKYKKAPNITLLILIALSSLWLRSLGNWLVYPLMAAVVGELIIGFFRKRISPKIFVIVIVITVPFFIHKGADEVLRLIQINVIEGALFAQEIEMLGEEKSRSLLDPFKALLGPGLVRPIFPHEYFIVWLPSFAAFYWLGTVTWYANLIVSAPLILKKPFAFLNKRVGVFVFLIFAFLVLAYTIAFGSGMGPRKRAMFHFFYTLFVAIVYFTPAEDSKEKGLHKWQIPVPIELLRLLVILALIVSTILSLPRV